jgi:DNA-binding NarL/FixJ family response regulator
MMKILLLRPDSEVYTSTPPLGILSLASFFRDQGKYEVAIYDGRAQAATVRNILEKVEEEKPDVVGLSLFAMERVEGHEAAHEIKKVFPDITIIFGGPSRGVRTARWLNLK